MSFTSIGSDHNCGQDIPKHVNKLNTAIRLHLFLFIHNSGESKK